MAKKIWDKDIDKYVDWGGDESTGGLPVSGRAVQKFIRDTLESKAGYFYYDQERSRYLVFADEEDCNSYLADPSQTELLIAYFDAPSNYEAQITLVDTETVNYIKYGSTGNYIKATFDIVDKASGASTGDSCTATITFTNGSSTKKLTRKVPYGTMLVLNVDEYLSEGTNTVIINIVGDTTWASTSTGVTYEAVFLGLTDSFNITKIYENDTNLDIQFTVYGSQIKYMEWWVDGVLQDQDQNIDIIVGGGEQGITKTRTIPLHNLSHGRHNLQYYAYTIMADGTRFYSDIMYRDFVIDDNLLNDTVILTEFIYPHSYGLVDAFDEPIPLYGVVQYEPFNVGYCIYKKSSINNEAMSITLGSKESIYSVISGNKYEYSIKNFNSGVTPLEFNCSDASLSYNATVEASTYNLRPITDTEFEFSGSDKTNESLNKDTWSFGQYTGRLEGFNFTETSGWYNGNLIIPYGASFVTDYRPFATEVKNNGFTFELEFKTTRVLDETATVLDLRNGDQGLLITASEITFTSMGNKVVSTKYKPEEDIRLTIVVNSIGIGAHNRLLFIYIDGVLTGAVKYEVTDSFVVNDNLSFTGPENATIQLKQIRTYRRPLSHNEVLNNYILYRDTVEELVSAYDRNDVYIDNTERLSEDKLAAHTPVIIITGDVEKIQHFTKDNKGTYVRMDKIEVINLEDQTKNMTLINPSMRAQGTSSMAYPRKNFRFYTQADGEDKTQPSYITQMFDYQGRELFGDDRVYSFKNKAKPVSCWCLKADYAESSSTHNTGIARLWNKVMNNVVIDNNKIDSRYYLKDESLFPDIDHPCRTIAQLIANRDGYPYDVRTTVDGFPIVLFYHEREDLPLIFLGRYNWNNDKSTESVYGFCDIPNFDNSKVECWEVVNGDMPCNLFTDISKWDNGIGQTGGWGESFEARYPNDHKKPSETERATGENSALKRVATWINSTKGASKVEDGKMVVDDQALMEKFKTGDPNAAVGEGRNGKWDYLDVYKVAAYYVYLMRFGAVDQTVKNAMFTTEDGKHWFYINYDNDTINGVKNDGTLRFGYDIDRQSEDPDVPGSYCYAGHASVLWNNLEADDEFMSIVREVDQALFDGDLNYDTAIAMFNDKQSAQWAERTHNEDYEFKYLTVGTEQLPKLQGPRKSHRQWWLSNRFSRMDAKNGVGSYLKNRIEIKPNQHEVGQNEYVTVVPAVDGQLFGFGLERPMVIGIEGYKDVPINFQMTRDYYVGTTLKFYNSIYMKSIDLTSIAPYIDEFDFSHVNSSAFNSELITLTLGTTSSKQNNAVTTIGENALGNFKYLENFSMVGYNKISSVNLSNNVYLKTVDVRNCAMLANVALPSAAPLTTIHYPSAIQTIYLNNLIDLNTIDIQGNGYNLREFVAHNCTGIKGNYNFLLNWIDNKNAAIALSDCVLNIDGVDWQNITPENLIKIGQFKVAVKPTSDSQTLGGVIRGKALLTRIDETIANQLVEYFGPNVFNPDADFYVDAPTYKTITGPSTILEGNNETYILAVFPQNPDASVQWLITGDIPSGASLTSSGYYAYISTAEVNSTRSFTLRAIYRVPGQSSIYEDKLITVQARTYPSNSTTSITGPNDFGDMTTTTFQETITYSQSFTGSVYATWSLTGDITNYATIQSSDNNGCVILRTQNPPSVPPSGTLTVVLKKILNGQQTVTQCASATMSVSILNDQIAISRATNPYAMDVLYNALNPIGLCEHYDYMLKSEAALVSEVDLQPGTSSSSSIFNSNDAFITNCTSFNEFKWFTRLTTIPVYLFYNCRNLQSIIIPDSVITVKANSLSREAKIDIDFPDSVSTIELCTDHFGRVHLGKNVESFSGYFDEISVDEANVTYGVYRDNNGIYFLYKKNNYELVSCSSIKSTGYVDTSLPGFNVDIPNFILKVSVDFNNRKGVRQLYIPASVVDISNMTCGAPQTMIIMEDRETSINVPGQMFSSVHPSKCEKIILKNVPLIPTYCIDYGYNGASPQDMIVDIPNTVTKISALGIFWANTDANPKKIVICRASTPPVYEGRAIVNATNIYVPHGCKNSYIQASGWSGLSGIIEELDADGNIQNN